MRFSFKKTLATVLSIAMILSAFVGVLTTSAAAANVVGTLTMDDVTASATAENKFDVVANINLDTATSYVHVAYKLGTLPEGVALDSVATNVGTATIDANSGAIMVDAGAAAVSAIAVTMTFIAPAEALGAFTIAIAAVDYADVNENNDTIDVTDTAVVTIVNHAASDVLCQGDSTHHWYPCIVEGCTEHKYGVDWHVWEDEVITPPTCTEPGVAIRSCKCGRGWGQVSIDPTGEHNYEYTNNGDDHTKTCTVGGESVVEAHTYVDGTCACGAVEETVEFNGSFRIKSVSLILGGEILIKYTMVADSGSLNDEAIAEYGILAWNEDVYDPNNIEYDPQYAIPCETEDHTFKIAKYSFEMTDVIYTRAYAILTDGTIIYGVKNGEDQAPVEYSVLKYATTQLSKTGSNAPDAATRNLLIAMLNYGAAAQEEFGYKVDTLANASLTDAEKNIVDATFDSDPQQGHLTDGKESVQNIENTRINGVSLVLSSAVLEKFYVKVSDEGKAIKNVTLLTWLEEDYNKLTDGAVVGTETYSELCNLEADGRYSGKSMGLYAFELRDDVFVRGYIEYEDGTFGYTKLFQTSAEYYARQQINKTSTSATTTKLLNAMMAYNDAAVEVFG